MSHLTATNTGFFNGTLLARLYSSFEKSLHWGRWICLTQILMSKMCEEFFVCVYFPAWISDNLPLLGLKISPIHEGFSRGLRNNLFRAAARRISKHNHRTKRIVSNIWTRSQVEYRDRHVLCRSWDCATKLHKQYFSLVRLSESLLGQSSPAVSRDEGF